MYDKFKEECGVFGIYGNPEAANIVYLGLQSLQHRGQESSGIVSSDGQQLYNEMGMGLVADVFTEGRLKKLPGPMAIGHNRYSTTGTSSLKNIQPFVVDYHGGSFSLAHNGNLINLKEIRIKLEKNGAIFRSTSDTEVIAHLIAQSSETNLVDRTIDALHKIEGAYSLLLMDKNELIIVRDPHGFRPLCLGRVNDAYVVASETCAFDLIEAEYIRDVEPGEIISISEKGLVSYKPFPVREKRFCIFEYIYFARPDSHIFGRNVGLIRKAIGKTLCQESPVEADMVVPVPDSGVHSAIGFSQTSGIPFEMGLIRSHYVGRTFIEPKQSIRHFGVKIKLNPIREMVKNQRLIVIDDSIVRGTTSRKIIQMLKEAGARETHVRIASPPTIYPCFFGIDTPTRKELIAAWQNQAALLKFLNADTLSYLTIEGLLNVFGPGCHNDFCTACFTGKYPLKIHENEQLDFFSTL